MVEAGKFWALKKSGKIYTPKVEDDFGIRHVPPA